jgi:low affinity Fe/Cu permease
MEHNTAADSRKEGDGRTIFERFVEHSHRRVSQAPFFIFCAGLVIVWLISFPFWTDVKSWETAIHTIASVFTLLIVVLLENAGRRAEEAAQEKLNVIATALAALMESGARDDLELRDATRALRDAVGLEERH